MSHWSLEYSVPDIESKPDFNRVGPRRLRLQCRKFQTQGCLQVNKSGFSAEHNELRIFSEIGLFPLRLDEVVTDLDVLESCFGLFKLVQRRVRILPGAECTRWVVNKEHY